jgi:hypothetical protein
MTARKSAARKRRPQLFALSRATINRLRELVPRRERSQFVERAIESALLDRELHALEKKNPK